MLNKIPFIKLIKNRNKYYIYDVNTNKIMEVDEIVFNAIKVTHSHADKNITNKLFKQYYKADLSTAEEEITSYSNKYGLFLANRPSSVQFGLNMEEIKEKLNSDVNSIILNVTNNCNMRCRYCPYIEDNVGLENRPKVNMSKDVALTAIDFFFRHNNRVQDRDLIIAFFGGEPLLNFDLIKSSVEHVKLHHKKHNRNFKFTITTNGTLLNNDIIKYLSKEKITLRISIDGPEEVHNANRLYKNEQGSFSSILRNMENMRNEHEEYFDNYVGFNAVIAPPYCLHKREEFFYGEGPPFYGKIEDSKMNFDYVYPYNTSYLEKYRSNEKSKDLRREQRILMKSFLNDISSDHFERMSFGRKLYSDKLYKLYKRNYYSKLPDSWVFTSLCIPGLLRPFVDVDGNIYICEKADNKMPIGSIDNDFDYQKIYQIVIDTLKICNSKCLNCWAIRLCGFCYVWLISGDLLDEKKMDLICKNFRKSMSKYIVWYADILKKKPGAFDLLFHEGKKGDVD